MFGINVASVSFINSSLDDGFGGIVKRERRGFATADFLVADHCAIPNSDCQIKEVDAKRPERQSRLCLCLQHTEQYEFRGHTWGSNADGKIPGFSNC